jgi:hypothetical protein
MAIKFLYNQPPELFKFAKLPMDFRGAKYLAHHLKIVFLPL